jgi:hypothetical protein
MLAANVTYLTLVAEALPLSLSLSPFLTLRRQQTLSLGSAQEV